ncbi:MAG TPA: histidine kinase [Gemmatimonadales bacterium]|nr:histidine kinase [Gemmatimonadales bacterium]
MKLLCRWLGPYPSWGRVRLSSVAAVWLLFGVVDEVRLAIWGAVNQQPFDLSSDLWIAAVARGVDVVLWTALTPAIFWFTSRYTVRQGAWAGPLAAQLAGGVLVVTLSVWLNWVLGVIMVGELPMVPFVARITHANLFQYGMVAGFAHILAHAGQAHERELRTSRLRMQLAVSQMEALKAQIEPHFLFNTLNSISELTHEDPDEAERMVHRLEHLLRITMGEGRPPEVSLAQELEFLGAYLEIQQTRFRDRLSVEIRVPPETLAARVPTFILQPLAENALRHGLAPQAEAGRIVVEARIENGSLRVEVCDSGVGFGPTAGREGLGIRNTRARLRSLYGPEGVFELRGTRGGGATASIFMPFRPAGDGETAHVG